MNSLSHAAGAGADLTAVQRETLRVLVGMLVPASADRRMPSAVELPQVVHQVERVAGELPALREGLDVLQAQATARYGTGFAALGAADRSTLVAEFAAGQPAVLQRLGLEVVTCYYQQDGVLERMGLEARPPYPLGHQVPAGDLGLLEPVVARGRIYRDAP